jgi:hypothetical protein
VGRSRGVVLSFLYWMLRRLLELCVLRLRPERAKEVEILVLRHNSPWMRRYPQPGFSRANRTTSSRTSRGVDGRPGCRRRGRARTPSAGSAACAASA